MYFYFFLGLPLSLSIHTHFKKAGAHLFHIAAIRFPSPRAIGYWPNQERRRSPYTKGESKVLLRLQLDEARANGSLRQYVKTPPTKIRYM